MSPPDADTAPVPPPPPPSSFGPITLTDIVRYQGASGDMNPSHHDGEFARANGFPGAFAPGLLSAGLLAEWATGWLGPSNVRRFGVRFRQQVWIGDVLSCAGEITRTYAAKGEQLVDLELRCQRGDEVVTAGWATFCLGAAPA